jgi:DNA/RNA endonuclease YhcR with UshA esterase domain
MKRFSALLAVALLTTVSVVHAQKANDTKPERKPQSAVAAKGKSFATVAATDAAVKNAGKADDLDAAKKQIGKTAAFTGTVDRVFAPKGNSVVLLNFAKDYKKAVVGAVAAKDFAAFPDLKTLKGKKVLVSGKVVEYKGQPQLELTDAAQIKIIP